MKKVKLSLKLNVVSEGSYYSNSTFLFWFKTDAFQTPCSTPPGSAASESESEDEAMDETLNSQIFVDQTREGLNELSLRHKLYDRWVP